MPAYDILVKKIDDLHSAADMRPNMKPDDERLIISGAIGQSMRPTILAGDKVIIDSKQIEVLKIGDIIVFDKAGLFMCHRIREAREKDGKKIFITMGDSCDKCDSFEVKVHEVIGKVILVIRHGRILRMPSYFKRMIRAILRPLGIYTLFKKVLFKTMRENLDYRFSLPRSEDVSSYRRPIDVMLKDISNYGDVFFDSLNSIAAFRISAYLGGRIAAVAEVRRLDQKGAKRNSWAVTDYYSREIFSDTELEAEILSACRFILDKIGVKNTPDIKRRNVFPSHF